MILNGQDIMLFATVNGTKKSIAFATNHTLEINIDTKETSTKDNGHGLWQFFELGIASWNASSENMTSDSSTTGLTYDDILDIMLNRTAIEIVVGVQGNLPALDIKNETSFNVPTGGWTPDASNHYKGNAYITSLNLTAQNGEKSTFTAQFTGCGPLLKVGNGFNKAAASGSK